MNLSLITERVYMAQYMNVAFDIIECYWVCNLRQAEL